MLNELIFLGQIPGTNFQITFTDIVDVSLLSVALLLCGYLYYLELRAAWDNKLSEKIQSQRFTVPVQAIGHISLALPANTGLALTDPFVFPIPQDA